MESSIIILLITIVLVGLVAKTSFTRVTIFEYERGLKYHKGQFNKLLRPGQYWFSTYNTTVNKIDIRHKFVSVVGQEVLSADSISLKISIVAQYEIADPYIAINRVESYQESLYIVLQLALREIVSSAKIDQLLERRNSFDERLMEIASNQVEAFGLRLISVSIKDIIFPGDLKKIFTQVIKAQKEGLAALEKARGETAALRNLANAAKMMENNPALMQLRLIQSLEDSSDNTFVLGMPSTYTPLPVKAQEVELKPTEADQVKDE